MHKSSSRVLLIAIVYFLLTYSFAVGQSPKVLSVNPSAGIPGSIVTIHGSNFNIDPSKNRVLLGQVEAEIISATNTTLQVKVPTGAGLKPIEVTNLGTGLMVVSNKRFTVTYPGPTHFDSTLSGPVNIYKGKTLEPIFIRLHDLNKDGRLDVLGTLDARFVSIHLNKSNPDSIAFEDNHNLLIPEAEGAYQLQSNAADLDGDGWEDLIVTINYALNIPGAVSVYLNNANRDSLSFTHAFTTTVLNNANTLELLDFDGDGKLDFYVTGFAAEHYKNTSTGVGNIQFSKINTALPLGMACDLNNDGLTDMLRELSFSLLYYRNTSSNGVVSYAEPDTLYFGEIENTIYSIHIGDVDGDELPDLLLGNNSIFKPSITLLHNTGTVNSPVFQSIEIPDPQNTRTPKLADIDGDGKLDIMAVNRHVSGVLYFQNLSTPGQVQFGAYKSNSSMIARFFFESADMDGDGKIDMIITDYNKGYTILRNRMNEARIHPNGEIGMCENSSRVLQSNIKQNNQWYKDGILIPSATSDTYTATTAGAYTVSAVVNGINYTTIRPVRIVISAAPERPVITLDGNNNLVSSAEFGNQWYVDNKLVFGDTARIYKPLLSGNYTVRVTRNGCTREASLPYYLIGTGVVEVDNNNETLAIFPNPVKSSVTIQFKQTGLYTASIRVFNATGTEVLQQTGVVSGERVNLSSLSKGYYLLQLINPRNNTIIATRKFMKL